ncbi:MAG TPA: magnesium transporter CorA family protein [Acidimicrobiales bacterium]|nr:magnesium transporter CorA family protein [Acidimicrobiales bacterium]
MSAAHTRAYRKGVLEAEGFPVSEVSDRLDDPDAVVWIDYCRPTADDLEAVAAQLGLHELAIEDALEPHQRPKVDRYPTHLFVTAQSVALDAARRRLDSTEVDAFVGPRWLVTVRSSDGFATGPLTRRWDAAPELVALGPGYLLHTLLDRIVDDYLATVDSFGDYYDDVSDGIFADTPLGPEHQRQWFEMRRVLVRFTRVVAPLREAASTLAHTPHEAIAPEVVPYFQDLYDHVIVVHEATESLRDLVTSLVEANLSLRDFRQNQVMKKVSSWAAIIAVPTLITGYYGMNVPYPTSGRASGVVVSVLVMVAASTGLYVLFRRRGWL